MLAASKLGSYALFRRCTLLACPAPAPPPIAPAPATIDTHHHPLQPSVSLRTSADGGSRWGLRGQGALRTPTVVPNSHQSSCGARTEPQVMQPQSQKPQKQCCRDCVVILWRGGCAGRSPWGLLVAGEVLVLQAPCLRSRTAWPVWCSSPPPPFIFSLRTACSGIGG